MRLNPTLSPTQLTRLNPRCQKYSRGSSSVRSFRNRSGRLSYILHPTFRQGAVVKAPASRRRKCVTLAPASISHFTSSGGKQFCNDIYIIINKVQFSSVQFSSIVSPAARFAIGGPNALKSLVLFLKVFQVIDDKTLTNKVSLNFHFLLPLVTSLKIDLSEDSFQESKSFELEIPVVSDPVVQQMSVKRKLFKSIHHLSVPRIL